MKILLKTLLKILHSISALILGLLVPLLLSANNGNGIVRLDSLESSSSLTSTIPTVVVRDTTVPSIKRFGISGHYVQPFHTTNFGKLSGVPSCCPFNYTDVTGLAWDVGAFGELPILPNAAVGLRLGLSQLNANLRFQEIKPVGSMLQPVSIFHTLETAFTWLSAEPYIAFRPIDFLLLKAGIGGQFTIASSYTQVERLDASAGNNIVFPETATIERNKFSGTPTPGVATFLPSITLGAAYEFPLTLKGTLLVAPEVFVTLPLGNLVNETQTAAGTPGSWTMFALRAGASVRFSPERSTRLSIDELAGLQRIQDSITAERQRIQDSVIAAQRVVLKKTEVIVKKAVTATITSVKGIYENTMVTENPTINVEEFLASRSRYILNNVFFGQGSADISVRYRRIRPDDRGQFRLERLADLGVLQIYYHVLNIIGKRMNTNPKATITLVGYADGLTEKNDKSLAELRTDQVRTYLEETWKIAPSRIKTKVGTSRTPTGADGDDILEADEQRRVEILSDTPAILEEMRFDYILREINPAKIRIEFDIFAGSTLKQWGLEGTQIITSGGSTDDKQMFLQGGGAPAPTSFEWDILASRNQPESREPIAVRITASDVNNVVADPPIVEIPVKLVSVEEKQQKNAHDERVDSYTLFSFAYGTNTPLSGNAEAQRVVEQIKQTLKPGARVIIVGYTDSRGNPNVNQALSTQRAQSVANAIGFADAQTKGVGATTLNDNRLPEGRFYNRFVQVDVRTPLR